MSSKDHQQPGNALLPPALHYNNVPMFVYRTLSALRRLGEEQSVQQYARADPDAHQAMLALSRAVAEAGFRIRDSGQMRDKYEDDPRRFTAGEIWLCDLAIDVAAMFVTNGGLSQGARHDVQYDLEKLDEHVHSHHWQKEVRKAGPGPEEFRSLRAHVPPHKPHKDHR
jgi:hypothetical protein